MSMVHSHLADDTEKIRSPGEQETLRRLENYLAVLEDNRKAARFIPDDAAMALDMASFVCNRLQGRQDRPFIPASRLALALVQTPITAKVQ